MDYAEHINNLYDLERVKRVEFPPLAPGATRQQAYEHFFKAGEAILKDRRQTYRPAFLGQVAAMEMRKYLMEEQYRQYSKRGDG